MGDPHWIEKATAKHKGALRATAKGKGMVKGDNPISDAALEKLANSSNKTTARRARLAQTLKKM